MVRVPHVDIPDSIEAQADHFEQQQGNVHERELLVLSWHDYASWHAHANHANCGAAIIASAAFLFSLSSLCVKLIMQSARLPVFEVTLSTALACLLGTTALLLAQGGMHHLLPADPYTRKLVALRAALGAATISLFYLSIQRLSLRSAVSLFFTSPVLAVVAEWALVPGSAPTAAAVGGCLAAVIGVWLIIQPYHMSHTRTRQDVAGIIMAIAAAASNAAAFVTVRMIQQKAPHAPSAVILAWWYHLLVACTAILPLLARYPSPPTVPSRSECLLLLCVTAAQFIGQVLLNRGFQLLSATRGSAINVLQVLFSYCWDVVVLQSQTSTVSLLGAALVITGVSFAAMADGSSERSGDKDAAHGLVPLSPKSPGLSLSHEKLKLQPKSPKPPSS